MADISVIVAGKIRQGHPLGPLEDSVMLPDWIVEADEFAFLVGDSSLRAIGMEKGDLLIAELRDDDPASGELVAMCVGERVFVGRFWKKHGRRDVTAEDGKTVLASHGNILAVINLIVRGVR